VNDVIFDISLFLGPTKHVDDRLQLHFWQNFCIFMFPPIPAIKREKQQKQVHFFCIIKERELKKQVAWCLFLYQEH